MRFKKPSLPRGIITGLTAGIIATLIMDQFFKLASSSQRALKTQQELGEGAPPQQVAREQKQEAKEEAQQEDSTEIFARKLAKTAGKSLTPEDKKTAGRIVHYTFGTLMGIVYCVTTEVLPEAASGGGTAFGTLLFLGADEIAVPALRLAPPPIETAPMDHLQHWAGHVVYGGALELCRSLLRKFI